jgi:hypothetical protein
MAAIRSRPTRCRSLDFNKQWYYVRLADKMSYERDGQELDATFYWWHRELKRKGFIIQTTLSRASRLSCG